MDLFVGILDHPFVMHVADVVEIVPSLGTLDHGVVVRITGAVEMDLCVGCSIMTSSCISLTSSDEPVRGLARS